MNQRVDELAWQAGCNQVSHHDPVRTECNGWIINQETLDRFAELLVRECARIADVNQAEDVGWNISEIIKEHFGVE